MESDLLLHSEVVVLAVQIVDKYVSVKLCEPFLLQAAARFEEDAHSRNLTPFRLGVHLKNYPMQTQGGKNRQIKPQDIFRWNPSLRQAQELHAARWAFSVML